MYTFIKSWAVSNDMAQTFKALSCAKEKHEGQFRKGNADVPYINHPLTLVCNAIALGIDEDDIIAACLLHDVVEDSDITINDLPVGEAVRKTVRKTVRLLTKKKKTGKPFWKQLKG